VMPVIIIAALASGINGSISVTTFYINDCVSVIYHIFTPFLCTLCCAHAHRHGNLCSVIPCSLIRGTR
jgi:hypothetical protein